MKFQFLNDDKSTCALIFDDGDSILEELKQFAIDHKLKASRFTGIGAFSNAMLGFFDYTIMDYKKIPVDEQVEVLTITGDISIFRDKPRIHAHVVLGKSDGSAMGGHLLSGMAHPTLELMLEESPGHLKREIDKTTGLPLIVAMQ